MDATTPSSAADKESSRFGTVAVCPFGHHEGKSAFYAAQ